MTRGYRISNLGYFRAHHEGLDEARASEVPRWRESPVFTALERDVLDYAEAMSETPPRVTDELSTRLLEQLGAPAVVELTAWVAFANVATRCNTALASRPTGSPGCASCRWRSPQPAKRPSIPGAQRVAGFLIAVARSAELDARVVSLNGSPAARIDVGGAIDTAVSVSVENGRITRIYAIRNPHKLGRLDRVALLARS